MAVGAASRVSLRCVVKRRAPVIAGLGVIVALPALFVGFHDDDFVHRLALSGGSALYRRDAFSLYEFLRDEAENRRLMDAGLIPWFSDPGLKIRFFRPLSSLLTAFDAAVFGSAALPAIVHSLLWFALAAFLVTRIHRELVTARAAFWSSLLFVLGGSHAGNTAWIAARHVLVGGAFALGAWYCELRTEKSQSGWLRPLSTGLFVVGLAASEATLTVLPFLLGSIAFRRAAVRQRVLSALPFVAASLAYLVFYELAGYGSARMGSYVSPFETPLRFALELGQRVPQLAAEAFSGFPAVLGSFDEGVRRALIAVGYLAFGLVTVLFLRHRARLEENNSRSLVWLPFAFALSLLPVAGTILDGRVLLVPLAGSSLLLGSLIVLGQEAGERGAGERRWPSRIGLIALFTLHLGVSPVVRVVVTATSARIADLESAMPRKARLRCAEGARVLLINGSDPAIGLYAGIILAAAGQGRWAGWHVLSMASNDLELRRDGPNAFVLRTLGERRAHFAERLYRPEPIAAGARVELANLTVDVLSSAEGGPTRTRFELGTPLDEACFVRWQGDADGYLESVILPVKGPLFIPHVPGPMGR